MKTSSLRLFLILTSGIIGLGFLAMPALGQDVDKVKKLQRIIEAQQKQLEIQQKQLDEHGQMMQALQTQIRSLVKDADTAEVVVSTEKPPEEPPMEQPAHLTKVQPQEKEGLSQAAKYDRESPTSTNVSYFDPAKTINISGTDTDIGIHGVLQFQMLHDSNGLNNNRFDTASIPVDGAPSQTKFNVNPTQLAISSTTPVSNGRLNTMISMDFNGQLDRPEPRLRVAYGELVSNNMGIGLLGGQTYTTMFDLKASPETLDFAGPAGLWQQRQPLLRFTKALAEKTIMEFALETPENVTYIDIDTDKLTRWPDLVAAGTWNAGGKYIKHARLAGLVRDLGAEDVNGATDFALGWALTGSAKIGLPFLGAKDNLKFTLHYGDGYGTQLKGGPTEGAFNTATAELETIGIFGSFGGIQHFWSDKFRSNLVYGYTTSDNPEFVSGETLDNTSYAAADLIWSPYEKISLGLEYLWGRRENKDGEAGTSNRLLFSSKLIF